MTPLQNSYQLMGKSRGNPVWADFLFPSERCLWDNPIMEHQNSAQRGQKSTFLLLVFIFFLFNTALMFRAGVNTLYFTEDTSADYVPVQAAVLELKPDDTVRPGKKNLLIPVFSFHYKGEEITRAAPGMSFSEGERSFSPGEEHTLWVHRNRGELLLPPRLGQREIGRSQLVVSAFCLLLAIGTWKVRNWFAARAVR